MQNIWIIGLSLNLCLIKPITFFSRVFLYLNKDVNVFFCTIMMLMYFLYCLKLSF